MIVSISGKIGSGKDTVGKIIQYLTFGKDISSDIFINKDDYYSKSNWKIKKFAGKLKQVVSLLTGCTLDQLEDQEFKNNKLGREWQDYDTSPKTYRWMLQTIGTESMRDIIHKNVWINALFSDYRPKHGGTVNIDFEFPNWIITDCRFPNELEAVKQHQGVTINIRRDNASKQSEASLHPSETALDDATFDYVIDNNGTLEELIEKIKNILIIEKILLC